ncbi:MAG: hypothetical protein AAF721_07945 [Myxococcota bacterium]
MRAPCLLGALLAVVGLGCYALGTFACADDSNCRDGDDVGVCQPTEYCSYPDETCESGQRYDELAGAGLAGQCVEAPVGEGETSTTAAEGSTGGNADESSGESGLNAVCTDEDGDGFGVGEACAGPDCDDDNPAATDNCLYLSPTGDDMAAGTRDAPWRTFPRVIDDIQPGTSVVVLDGVYPASVHGSLAVDCDDNAPNGTAEAPIFVRADNERQAQIQTGGLTGGVRITRCAYWRVRGLTLEGADAPGRGEASPVAVRQSDNVELRGLLVHTDNRYHGDPLLFISASTNVLVEDSEVYDFIGAGVHVSASPGITLRRVYANGRGREDDDACVDGGPDDAWECSTYDLPDHGLLIGQMGLVENSVSEGANLGIVGVGVVNPVVLGSAVVGGTHGVIFGAQSTVPTEGPRVEHVAGVGQSGRTVYFRSVGDAIVRNVTSVDTAGAMRADKESGTTACPGDVCRVTGANLLSINSSSFGFSVYDDYVGSIGYSNVFGSTDDPYFPTTDDPFDDEDGFWQNSLSVAAEGIGSGDDECIAYVPADSNMVGLGENGDDIGASLLFRYHEGVLTDEPLWERGTGRFPCGAQVAGVNDDPATSCIGVHERLHVGTVGCPLPYPPEMSGP